MEVTPAAIALAFVATLTLLAGFWAWLIAAARAAISWRLIGDSAAARLAAVLQSLGIPPRLPLLAWNPRRLVPWTGLDLLTFIGLYMLMSATAAHFASYQFHDSYLQVVSFHLELTQEGLLIAFSTLASFAILAVGLPLISVRTGASPRDFGISARDLGKDLKTGVVAFVMLAPPVYAVQGLLVSLWQESKHPLVEMFKEQPTAGLFMLLFASAAIVAPLFEEVLFRVLLQGFLEKLFAHRSAGPQPPIAATRLVTEAEAQHTVSDLQHFFPLDNNPHSPSTILAAGTDRHPAEADEPCLRAFYVPIVTSSTIFAALHYSHGPDWVPLFFLALGLGYLYQRTHRLLPGLIVHSLLNATSLWGLWITVHQPPAA